MRYGEVSLPSPERAADTDVPSYTSSADTTAVNGMTSVRVRSRESIILILIDVRFI